MNSPSCFRRGQGEVKENDLRTYYLPRLTAFDVPLLKQEGEFLVFHLSEVRYSLWNQSGYFAGGSEAM